MSRCSPRCEGPWLRRRLGYDRGPSVGAGHGDDPLGVALPVLHSICPQSRHHRFPRRPGSWGCVRARPIAYGPTPAPGCTANCADLNCRSAPCRPDSSTDRHLARRDRFLEGFCKASRNPRSWFPAALDQARLDRHAWTLRDPADAWAGGLRNRLR
jgi:hypothetical protein